MSNEDYNHYLFDSFEQFLNGQIQFSSRNSDQDKDLEMHLVEEKEMRKTDSFEDCYFYSSGDEWWLPIFRNQDEDILNGPSQQNEDPEQVDAPKK